MKNATSLRARQFLRGFTLVEIMVVVTIIGLLVALAIPALQRVQRRAQNSSFVSDLRTYAQAFETYAMEHGTWPPNGLDGTIPASLVGDITNKWRETNTLGGRWNWDTNRLGISGGIATTNVTAIAAQMAEVDAMIDDGDVTSGSFRLFGTRYILVLEE